MARLTRVIPPGYPHHIIQRDNRRQIKKKPMFSCVPQGQHENSPEIYLWDMVHRPILPRKRGPKFKVKTKNN